jgi:PAS domain S-box-containing protein
LPDEGVTLSIEVWWHGPPTGGLLTPSAERCHRPEPTDPSTSTRAEEDELQEEGEIARLCALEDHQILDTPPEPAYDRLVELAAHMCGTPIAVLTLLDHDRQWFKATVGLDVTETPRSQSFCAFAVQGNTTFVVPDALADERFRSNPLVTVHPAIRFYAGAPIRSADGLALGALAVIDTRPRTLTTTEQALLESLAEQASALMELRVERERAQRTAVLLKAQRDEVARAHSVLDMHVENSPLAVVEWDQDFRVVRWTGGASRTFGWTEEDVKGLFPGDWAFVHPDDLASVEGTMADLLSGQVARAVSHNRNFTRDGEVLHCVWYSSVLFDSDQQVTSILCLVDDVTDLKQAEHEVESSAARFQMLAEATTDAVWDWNLEDDSVWWSEGLERLFGFSPEEIEPDSTSWTSRIHPDDHDRVVAGLHSTIRTGRTRWSDRFRFARKDGDYAVVLDNGQVVHDDSGRPIRMVGGMTDITRHVELEDRLRQAQRLEAVGKLTGGIAHDFNNLLTVIQGGAAMLQEQLDDQPDLLTLATMIETAAKRSGELTHRLLAFARRQALDPSPTEVRTLVEGMSGLLRRSLGEHIEIVIGGDEARWLADIDAGELENAVLNLCINARDAMPDGGRLTIEVADVPAGHDRTAGASGVPAGDHVVVAVSDTGKGIPPELLARVFEPFVTTKDIGEGTGLGLAMVHGFVTQSGGHVSMESEPGQGTTVRLFLPRHTGPSQPIPPPEASREETIAPVTVLVVEDHDLVRRYAVDQLNALGCTVLEAADGPAALAILQERDDVELLFTDVIMAGGMTGRALADAAADLHPGIRVLFTSGYTENALGDGDRLAPGIRLLTKPYDRAQLADQVRAVMEPGAELYPAYQPAR